MGLSWINFEYVGHLAYTLGVLSFVLKDILWLRLVMILSATLCIVFNYAAPAEPMWVAIYWNSALAGINVLQVGVLLFERRKIVLDEREKWLYANVFPNFTPVEFARLMKAATWKSSSAGETLIVEGQTDSDLILITDGRCMVRLPEGPTPALQNGDFVGEMSFLTGKVASATVLAENEVDYVAWSRAKLQQMLKKNPAMDTAIRSAVSHQLTDKIVKMSRGNNTPLTQEHDTP